MSQEQIIQNRPLSAVPGDVHCKEFSADDRKVLVGIASYQLRYKQYGDALAILVLCRKLWPTNLTVLKALLSALVAVKNQSVSGHVLEEIAGLLNKRKLSPEFLFLQSLMLLQKMELAKARKVYETYIKQQMAKG